MSFKFNRAHASALLSLCLGSSVVASAIAQTPAPPAAAESAPQAPQDMADQAPTTAAAPSSGGGTSANSVENIVPPAPAAAIAPGPCCTLADGSPVQLEVVGPISSKTALRGQTFALRLAHPLRTAEGVLLPAGTTGAGEVIHAERSRGGGKAGELILAARYLQGPDGPIKLRGMKLGGSGNDKTGAAMGASLILPLGGFIRGSEIEIPAGTPASAKLAGAIRLPPMPAAAANAAPNMDTAEAAPASVAGQDMLTKGLLTEDLPTAGAPTSATPPASAPSSPTPTPTPIQDRH